MMTRCSNVCSHKVALLTSFTWILNNFHRCSTESCRREVNLVNSQLKIFIPMRKQPSMLGLSLGKRFGIQFGGLSVDSEFFPAEVRGKHAVDSLIVAHGMTRFQSAANWAQQDIDNILVHGSKLYAATKEVPLEKLVEYTKGFPHKKKLLQVTVSEPKVVGKVMTLTDRSVDLRLGLEKFFSQYGHGILQTPTLDLYIAHDKLFYVFDPRGRTMDCWRCQGGEASLMAFVSLQNVFHLIINLSEVNVRDPFKISHVTISKVMDGKSSPEKFTASCGNPSKSIRSDDYKPFDHQISYLRGSIHLGSSVFGNCAGKQHLTTAIMAMVYAKIDPPNTWAANIFDRVFHFGAKLFRDVIDKEAIRNLAIGEIPSKFYVDNFYRAGIAIVPFLKQPELMTTHLICDNPVKKAFDELFEQTTFRMFLLQIDNFTFAVWKMKSSELFFFFDGCQKDVEGEIDRFEGSSHLFLVKHLDNLCELIVNRLTKIRTAGKPKLNIHGMKIFELTKLTKDEQLRKPKFKILQQQCIKPMNAEAGQQFKDSPSIVDSVVPLVTASQVLKMREKLPEKPIHRKVADLNSPSLVCCKERVYEEIMSSVEKKPSVVTRKEFPKETINMASAFNSQLLLDVLKEEPEPEKPKPRFDPCAFPPKCRSFVECCDNVVFKTDSRCLEQEQVDTVKAEVTDEKTEAVQSPEIALSAASSKSKVVALYDSV